MFTSDHIVTFLKTQTTVKHNPIKTNIFTFKVQINFQTVNWQIDIICVNYDKPVTKKKWDSDETFS
jgi:hypothetical protein